MSQILAIEASTDQCSAALRVENADYAVADDTPRAHAQNLLPMVKHLLESHDCSLNNLDAIVYGEGPGSFTGLRIALSIAQGLAYGADLPLISICGLNALAYKHFNGSIDTEPQNILTLMDARMKEVYWSLFSIQSAKKSNRINAFSTVDAHLNGFKDAELLINERLIRLSGDAITEDKGLPHLGLTQVVGGGFELLSNDFIHAHKRIFIAARPCAEAMLDLSELKLRQGQIIKPECAEPLYLRNSVAWNKRKRIRQI